MIPRAGGALLVLLAASAAFGRFLPELLVASTAVWLLCLRRDAPFWLVLAVALAVRLPFAFAPYFSDDLYRYLWEGKVQLAGFNPYLLAPADPALAHLRGAAHHLVNHPEVASVYPPLAQALFRTGAGLGLGEAGLRNVVLGLDGGVVAVLLGWLRATGRPAGRAIVYAWSPLAVASAGVGHLDPLMLLFLAGCGWAWERGRVRTAAALLGGAILAKTVAVLLVPWLLLRRPRAALVLLPVVALGYLPFAAPGMLDPLLSFGTEFAFNASLFRALALLPAPHLAAALLLALWTVLVALTQPRYAAALALLFAGLLLLSPTVHFWYLTWFLVALPAAGLRPWTWPLVVWTATVAAAAETYRAHYLDGAPFTEHFALTAVEYLVPAAVALWLLRRHWPRRPRLAPPRPAPAPPFSVVVPCRGEASNLRSLVPRWLAAGAERVVLADLPTGDGTADLAGPRVTYLPVARRGYGAAVQAGLAALDGTEVAVVCDADHARGPEQAGALLAPFADPRVGLVTAARPGARLARAQRLGNALASALIALGWGRRFFDLGPFRALRLAAWPPGALRDPGYGWNVEMNVRALELGMDVVEVPLEPSERAHGENRISGTLLGVLGAGYGILAQLYRLKEESCRQPS